MPTNSLHYTTSLKVYSWHEMADTKIRIYSSCTGVMVSLTL